MSITRSRPTGSKHQTSIHSPGDIFKRFGWNKRQFDRLANSLRTIRDRFNTLTDHAINLNISYSTWQPPADAHPLYINILNGEIFVYLSPGPEKVLGNAPFLLSRELSSLFFASCKDPELFITHIQRNILNNRHLIDSGLDYFSKSYDIEANAEPCEDTFIPIGLDEPSIFEDFQFLAERYGIELVKLKLSFCLLPPDISPIPEIERMFKDAYQEINKIMFEEEIGLGNSIAHLAMLAVLAKKKGAQALSDRCKLAVSRDALWPTTLIEILERCEPFERREITKIFQQQPLAAIAQSKQASQGYEILFELFQRVFESIYDSLLIGNLDLSPYHT